MVSDGAGATARATVSVTVRRVDDPVEAADRRGGDRAEDTAMTIVVLASLQRPLAYTQRARFHA